MTQLKVNTKILRVGLTIIAGALSTLALQYQNSQMVYQGAYYKTFFHPYMQVATLFVGEAFCYLLFIIQVKRNPDVFRIKQHEAKCSGKSLKCNPLLFAIPAFMDFIALSLQYIALNFIAGSLWVMLKSGVIVTIILFSFVLLKTTLNINHYFGCLTTIAGISFVAVGNYVFSFKTSVSGFDVLTIRGVILVAVSLLPNGFSLVFQEKMLNKYHLEPLQIIGVKGLWGLLFSVIIIPIFTFIPCNFNLSTCVITQQSFAYFEIPKQYFSQASQSLSLIIFIFIGIFSTTIFNLCGVLITKHINSFTRSVVQVTSTIPIYLIGIIITVVFGKNYQWQAVNFGAIIVEMTGFGMFIFGILILYKIILVVEFNEEYFEQLVQRKNTNVQIQEPQENN